MKSSQLTLAIIGVCILFFGTCAYGFGEEDISVHGFVSQGYMKSFENNYFGKTTKGSYEFNEIGINFSKMITDDLMFGVQLFSRDIGNFGNNEFKVDWASLSYNLHTFLGFRAGKIKLPFGLYNRKRDADMLRTSIILTQSVYPEGLRDLLVGIYGASLYGIIPIGVLGYLDYELIFGDIDVPIGSPYIKDLVNKYELRKPENFVIFKTLDLDPMDITLDIYHMEGGMMIWNTPIDGFRLGGAAMRGKGSLELSPIELDIDFKGLNSLSMEYEIGGLTIVAEYMNIRFLALDEMTEIMGWYCGGAWEMTEWLSLGATYGEHYPEAADKDGSEFKSVGYPDYYAWQKETTISARFNMTEYWCIKLETHFINGLGGVSLSENDKEDAKQHWTFYAIKTSLQF
ncbi:MAG: hypothetical protein KJ737_09785 [Proteobacteria bacterium]|nr:hypothetical protein [Pseudomonadota bacterium]